MDYLGREGAGYIGVAFRLTDLLLPAERLTNLGPELMHGQWNATGIVLSVVRNCREKLCGIRRTCAACSFSTCVKYQRISELKSIKCLRRAFALCYISCHYQRRRGVSSLVDALNHAHTIRIYKTKTSFFLTPGYAVLFENQYTRVHHQPCQFVPPVPKNEISFPQLKRQSSTQRVVATYVRRSSCPPPARRCPTPHLPRARHPHRNPW